MKILLLGCNGQVGWELQRSLAPLGEVIALGRDASSNPEGLAGDLSNPDALRQTVQRVQPKVIVNAAAYTAVDKAESEPETAHLINATAPQMLAQEAQKLGALLVHFSTDYVFDGSGNTAWHEADSTGPLNVYGQTKLAGEKAIEKHCANYLIFRTSWVYAARGGNFAKTMLRLAQERETLKVIDDQWGAPTGAELLADVTALAIHANLQSGTYHLAASGETTWHAYAKHVIDNSGIAPALLKVKEILPVASSAFPTPARRPNNSRLDTSKLQKALGIQLPNWQMGVNRMLKEIQK